MIHDDSWWFMMIHDDSWWFMMVHDDSWWFMTFLRMLRTEKHGMSFIKCRGVGTGINDLAVDFLVWWVHSHMIGPSYDGHSWLRNTPNQCNCCQIPLFWWFQLHLLELFETTHNTCWLTHHSDCLDRQVYATHFPFYQLGGSISLHAFWWLWCRLYS